MDHTCQALGAYGLIIVGTNSDLHTKSEEIP